MFRSGSSKPTDDWGMFSTRSSVTQLKPETVLQWVHQAEEDEWGKGDLNGYFPHESSVPSPGIILLSQSGSIKKIHNYFSQLESRKCCLHLACRRTTINSIRVVVGTKPADDGSEKKSRTTFEVLRLENEELRAFKHAYLCAVYPVLAAPNPPSPASPSPVLPDSGTASMSNSSSVHHFVSYTSGHDGPSDKVVVDSGGRPITPYSLHDSGVEESEEAGLIPMESICEQLQRAFRLSRSLFRQYENLIIKTYAEKTSQKLLAEELCGQLAVLERNNHPFYSPANFITQNGYDLWQKQERAHICNLLNKFWHSSLPFPADIEDLIAELHTVHEDYLILLKKLLSYESQFRLEGSDRNSSCFSSLSSASCRLLIEFGLRYGIGELFQKVHHLECLSHEFNLSVGYLSFIHHLVHGIQQTLPGNKASVIMVRKELNVLQSTLRTLKVQTCKALSQMKSHFPSNKPAEGTELLLSLLHTVLSLMRYLAPSGQTIVDFEICLKSTIQSAFQPTYERFKMVAKNDLGDTRETRVTPRLLNLLIQDIREDVSDYRMNFESTFEQYFSISRLAAISYYQYLIEDVRILSQEEICHKPEQEIDLRVLALAYRLNQLEGDWKPYISELKLTWRTLFLPNVHQWTSAMKVHMQNLILEAVSCDTFNSKNIELPSSTLRDYRVSSTSSDRNSRSISINPSMNSAFSSIVNTSSTPTLSQSGNSHGLEGSIGLRHESILEAGQEQSSQDRDEQSIDINHGTMKQISSFACETRSLYSTEQSSDTKTAFSSSHRQFSLPAKLNLVVAESEENVFPFGNPEEVSIDASNQSLDQTDGNRIRSSTPVQSNTTSVCSRKSSESLVSVTESLVNVTDSLVNARDSPLIAIVSDDSENEDEDQGQEHPDSSDEESPKFRFPPLVLKSPTAQAATLEPDLPDFRPSADFLQPNFILSPGAPPSVSSKTPSIVEQPDTSSLTENYHSDSVDSMISFPSPIVSQRMLPISGSAVDLLIMLQRICHFGQNVINIMLPGDTSRPNSRVDQRPVPGYFDVVGHQYLENSSSPPASPSREESDDDNPKEEKRVETIPSTGARNLSSSNPQTQPDPSSSILESPSIPLGDRKGEQVSSAASEWADGQSAQKIQDDFYALKFRLSLYLKLFKLTCNAVTIYTCNMLCMDLCGTSREIARHMVGPKLLEIVQSQQADGLIWGCRHQTETGFDCLYYPNHQSRLLNGRYEAVTQNMATRINNVYACLQFMEDFKDKLSKALKIGKETNESSFPSFEDQNWKEFDLLWQDFSTSMTYDGENQLASKHLRPPLIDVEKSESLRQQWSRLVEQAFNSTKCHIMAVLSAMCRLLAHKLNLFLHDGLPLLLYLKKDNITIPDLMERITSFLQRYLDALSNWLYDKCFRRTLNSLWIFMVQDFETEAEALKSNGSYASADAHNWLLTISHLMKFMNNEGKGIKHHLMLSEAENVLFRLQLYTLPTIHLIALFLNLREYYFEGDHLTLEETQLHNPPSILHRIYHDLQSRNKCFSGAQLVRWIVKHKDDLPADLPGTFSQDTQQSAVTLCQLLLDQQFILEIDFEFHEQSSSPLSISYPDGVSPFPQLSVHSYHSHSDSNPDMCDPMAGNVARRRFMSEDDENTTEDTETEQEDKVSVISFRADTPVGEIMVQADVHSSLCDDAMESTDKSQVASQDGESAQQRPAASAPAARKVETVRTPSPNLNTIHEGPPYSQEHFRNHKDSVTSDESCFMDMPHNHTPFGSIEHYSPHGCHSFQPSPSKFYFIHQNALHTGLASQSTDLNSRHRSTLSKADRTLLMIRTSKESHSLVEQCIVHKVSSMTLLSMIATRKKADQTAKEFLNKLPSSLRNKVYKQLGAPVIDCRSS